MKSVINKACKEMIQHCESDCSRCKYDQWTPFGMNICSTILNIDLSTKRKEDQSEFFIQGHTYVMDEALFIDKVCGGSIRQYKKFIKYYHWVADVLGLKFIVSDKDNDKVSIEIIGRSGITWSVGRSWCIDITKEEK